MNFLFSLDKHYIPSNLFTSITLGITGYVLITVGRFIPNVGILNVIVLLLIPCGLMCYVFCIVGIIATLVRYTRKLLTKQT